MSSAGQVPLEDRTGEIGQRMFEVSSQHTRGFLLSDSDSRMMEWGMHNEKLKVQFFRFADELPMLRSSEDVLDHSHEYPASPGVNFRGLGLMGLNVASSVELGRHAVAGTRARQISGMAGEFIAGSAIRTLPSRQTLWAT